MASTEKVVDYFVVVGISGKRLEQAATVRSEEQLFTEVFTGEILGRYPFENDELFPIDELTLPMFCFPRGLRLSRDPMAPDSHSFVLTKADGYCVYGFCYVMYEEFRHTMSSSSYSHDVELFKAYTPKCLVILSHWPLFSSFHKTLALFHAHLVSLRRIGRSNPSSSSSKELLPIECLISFVCNDIPLPLPGGSSVVYSLPVSSLPWSPTITLTRPSTKALPWLDLPIRCLLEMLSLNNILLVFKYILLEQRIIFVSSNLGNLTIAIELLTKLMFPFSWQHVFVPLLSLRLTHFLEAPVPFIVGLPKSESEDQTPLPENIILVDLDTNLVSISDSAPKFKEKPFTQLLETLLPYVDDPRLPQTPKIVNEALEITQDSIPQSGFYLPQKSDDKITNCIRQCFLDFFISIFNEYENYILREEDDGDTFNFLENVNLFFIFI